MTKAQEKYILEKYKDQIFKAGNVCIAIRMFNSHGIYLRQLVVNNKGNRIYTDSINIYSIFNSNEGEFISYLL